MLTKQQHATLSILIKTTSSKCVTCASISSHKEPNCRLFRFFIVFSLTPELNKMENSPAQEALTISCCENGLPTHKQSVVAARTSFYISRLHAKGRKYYFGTKASFNGMIEAYINLLEFTACSVLWSSVF